MSGREEEGKKRRGRKGGRPRRGLETPSPSKIRTRERERELMRKRRDVSLAAVEELVKRERKRIARERKRGASSPSCSPAAATAAGVSSPRYRFWSSPPLRALADVLCH
ncbi:uncharacterized protein DS421_3g76970 [Arachis hypogaea]|nr:uncharacterized protein DS421_3g76970 [Arachis hypogaea]